MTNITTTVKGYVALLGRRAEAYGSISRSTARPTEGMLWINITGLPEPCANFATEHKCKDFDAIREWAVAHDEESVLEFREGDNVLDRFP